MALFHIFQAGDHNAQTVLNKLVEPANEAGMLHSINPIPLAWWGQWPNTRAGRMSYNSFSGNSANKRPVWAGITVADSVH